MSLIISDFSLFFMQKLHPLQKEGYTLLEALELRTDRLQARKITIKFLFFIYYFFIFHMRRLAQGFKGSQFEFYQSATLGWAILVNRRKEQMIERNFQ